MDLAMEWYLCQTGKSWSFPMYVQQAVKGLSPSFPGLRSFTMGVLASLRGGQMPTNVDLSDIPNRE